MLSVSCWQYQQISSVDDRRQQEAIETMRKAVVSAITLAGIAPLLFLSAAPRAEAANSCYETGCNGIPAAGTTCANDAEVVEQVYIPGGGGEIGYIQLKYSPSCRAAWARVITNLDYGSSASVSNTNGNYADCGGAEGAPGTGCNTAMINDGGTESLAIGVAYENSSLSEYGEAETPSF
jgi:hypothetical protein